MPSGLQDVIAGQSGICFIDGEQGLLSYRGYSVHELAPNSTFEETSHLLWFGALPSASALEETHAKLVRARAIPREATAILRAFPRSRRILESPPSSPSTEALAWRLSSKIPLICSRGSLISTETASMTIWT